MLLVLVVMNSLLRRARRLSSFLLRLQPAVEVLLRADLDDYRHEAVIAAAQLGALPAIEAALAATEPHFVDEAGNRVLLHAERRHPPRVDDVAGRQQDAHLLAD